MTSRRKLGIPSKRSFNNLNLLKVVSAITLCCYIGEAIEIGHDQSKFAQLATNTATGLKTKIGSTSQVNLRMKDEPASYF